MSLQLSKTNSLFSINIYLPATMDVSYISFVILHGKPKEKVIV